LNGVIKIADEMFGTTPKEDWKHRCNVQSVRDQYRNNEGLLGATREIVAQLGGDANDRETNMALRR
jgi:hypothetical protein